MLDRVFQAALLADPPLVLPLPEVISIASPSGSVRILSIAVPAGLPYVYSLDGRYLGREGSQTNPFPARRLRLLLMERGVVQFESRFPPDARLDDLDPQQIEAYLDVLRLPGGEKAEEMLVRRGCLRRVEGELRPTYAALLLFGRYPQQWLPAATLLAVRFTGLAFSDHFVKQEINGTLPEQIRQMHLYALAAIHSPAGRFSPPGSANILMKQCASCWSTL
jgi:ATP-dependent DNA helicase RecG